MFCPQILSPMFLFSRSRPLKFIFSILVCRSITLRKTTSNILSLSECPDKLKDKITLILNSNYACGKFIRVREFIYIYSHGKCYSSCSSMHYSHIEDVFSVTVVKEDLRKCTESAHHCFLEPSFLL